MAIVMVPVRWHTRDYEVQPLESKDFIQTSLKRYRSHLKSHNKKSLVRKEHCFYDYEAMYLKFPKNTDISVINFDIFRSNELKYAYEQDLIFARALGFNFQSPEYMEATHFDRFNLNIANKVQYNANGHDDLAVFPGFIPFIPKGGFPYFGINSEVMRSSQKYFAKALQTYDELLQNFSESNILSLSANERSELIVKTMGAVRNSDLNLENELRNWREASADIYGSLDYKNRTFLSDIDL